MVTSIALSAEGVELAHQVIKQSATILRTEPNLTLDQAFWRTGNASPVYGLLVQLMTDTLGRSMYGWMETQPKPGKITELLEQADQSLAQAGRALFITSRRFSQDDIALLDKIRRAQLGRSARQRTEIDQQLEDARLMVERAAANTGRTSLLKAVLNATGTANVPQSVSDAAMVTLVEDLPWYDERLKALDTLMLAWGQFMRHV